MKNRIFIALIFCILISSCNLKSNSSNPDLVKAVSLKEDFNSFFKKFNTDSVFQQSRIIFPLKVIIPDEENNNIKTKFIPQKQWKYFDLTKYEGKKSLLTTNRLNEYKITIHYSVEDTGIGVDYFFVNKKGLWRLSSVKDESD